MPLRDHFHPPLAQRRTWQGVHGGWPMVMVQMLSRKLPARYVAEPQVHLGSIVEVDIATFEESGAWSEGLRGESEGGVAVWAPPGPSLAVATEAPSLDEYAVRVYDLESGKRLVAAVEIVSPANKDRPEHRRAFVNKCEALLREGVSVAIVDIVTSRTANLYGDLMEQLGSPDPGLSAEAVAYAAELRWRPAGKVWRLETWTYELKVGEPLPILPLWLEEELAIPLELESSYEETCKALRIP